MLCARRACLLPRRPRSLVSTSKRTILDKLFKYKEGPKNATLEKNREAIKRSMGRGGWEMMEISKTKARPFDPVITMVNPRPFPKALLKGTRLDGEEVDLHPNFAASPATLVLVHTKRILSEFMGASWKAGFRERYPDLPVAELLVNRDRLYALLNPFVNGKIRATHSEEDLKNLIYVTDPRSIDFDPAALGINVRNTYICYAFIVDQKGGILLSAAGKALPSDLYVMNKMVDTILENAPKSKIQPKQKETPKEEPQTTKE